MFNKSILLPLASVVFLSACVSDEPSVSVLDQRDHPHIVDINYTHALNTNGQGQVSPLALVEAAEFIEKTAPNHGDTILIAGGRSKDQEMLIPLIHPTKGNIVQDPDPNRPMHIHITKAVIQLEQCGQWAENPGEETGQSNAWNAGCATRNNLARMLDTPNDLRHGRAAPHRDANIDVLTLEAIYTGNFDITGGIAGSASGGGE